jgi:hypothetical protein
VGTQEEIANWLAEGNGTWDDHPVDIGLLRRLAARVERRTPVHQQSGYTGGGHGESNVTLRSNSVEEESVEVSLSTPTRAVEEAWGYRPARVCSQESSDIVGCVEAGVEGMRDGVVGESLEVVEAGFLLCDLTGKGLAVVKEMGFQNVGLQIMAHRRWRNGKAMLVESVAPNVVQIFKHLLLLKEKCVRQNSTFLASSSAHDARRHLHP